MASLRVLRQLPSFLFQGCTAHSRILPQHFQKKIVTQSKFGLSSLQVIYSEHGSPNEVLSHRTVEISTPLADHEILVRMLLAPVNPSDMNMIEGTYFIRPPLPAVVGNEGVGEVVEVGSAVTTFKVGDWVNPADSGFGTWRTYALCEEKDLSKIPNDIPPLHAATIIVNTCTAYRLLKDFVSLHPGDVVMQNGANSAVGQAVIQLAREQNFITVNIVRNRSDFDNLSYSLRHLGANHVITEEFCRSNDMQEFMKSLPAKPRLAFNCIGGKSSTELLRNLDNKGVMVTYGGMSRQPVVVPTGALIFKEVKVVGYWNSEWNKQNKGTHAKQNMMDELCALIRQGKLKPPAHDYFPINDYKSAVASATQGFTSKKAVLQISEDIKF